VPKENIPKSIFVVFARRVKHFVGKQRIKIGLATRIAIVHASLSRYTEHG
jgi:hypothetical protein